MRRFLRRSISCQLLIVLWAEIVFASAATGAEFTRPAMLQNMAANVVVPGVKELTRCSEGLSVASEKLQKSPSPENLLRVQAAWKETCLAWKRVRWIQFGPVKDRTYWTALFYQQIYPQSVEGVMRKDKPIDQDMLEELGASAKGLYALEYLLFDSPMGQTAVLGPEGKPSKPGTPRLSEQALLMGEKAERRRTYVREVARELSARLKEAETIVIAPEFVTNYVKEGQNSINLAVNGLLDEMENGVVNVVRLYVDQFANRVLRYEQIEGSASGISTQVLEAELSGLEKLYRGGDGLGFDDYLQQVNPGLAKRLNERLMAGKKAMQAFHGRSIDQALAKNYGDMEQAHDELHELEIQIKLDVVSSLGVTLLFSSTDGD
jgi:predicted lipoprotein